MRKCKLTTMVLGALLSTQSLAVDFHGYARTGYGISNHGGGLSAGDEFEKSKLGRLGNEFDTFAEIGLGQALYKDGAKSIYFESMFEMSSDGYLETEKTQDDTANFAIKQLNLQAKGFISAAPEATIWIGKRFYQRHDIHIIDTKYWNISGYGLGLEGVNIGPGALSAAIIRGDQNDININYLDLRYAGIKPWQDAWVEIGIDYAMPNLNSEQEDEKLDFDNAVMLTAELSQGFSKGFNKTVLQYADKGLAQNMVSQGGGWYDAWDTAENAIMKINKAKGYRLINTGDFYIADNFMFQHVITFGYAQDHETLWSETLPGVWGEVDSEQMFSAVVRPAYNWSKNHKTLFELGYFKQSLDLIDGGSSNTSGQKYTVSQVISAGEYILARPELRLYASYVKNGDGDSFNGGKDDDDLRLGVQIEAWW